MDEPRAPRSRPVRSQGRQPTKESDCYALGMVIYEVLSGQAPFASFKDFIVMRKVIEGERPGRPEGAEGRGSRTICGGC
jgi:serine/threonine protein kinase